MNKESRRVDFVRPELTVQELSVALYQANKKLKKTNEELLQSQRELSEVFANISHDLRSPITAIRNSVEYLLSMDTLDKEEAYPVMQLIHRRVDFLEQMIKDIFLLSSLDASHKAFHFEKVNMGMFLEDFYYNCEADRKYAKRTLCLSVPEDFPYQAYIDCHLMARVLDNLFTNALNYSEEGAKIELAADKLAKDTIVISVNDTGFGIAKEHLTKIFDRTYKVEAARTPGVSTSCGIGLAIAKSVVENHGGRIWCESEQGVGSSFRFTLPVTA